MVSFLARDPALYFHVIVGLLMIVLPILILLNINNKKSRLLKPLSFITATLSWLLLIPSGRLYISFYPATKTLIKAGSRPWVHSVLMETKEHWGLLLPIIATVATGLVFSKKFKQSKKWWILLIILSALMGIIGWFISNRGVT